MHQREDTRNLVHVALFAEIIRVFAFFLEPETRLTVSIRAKMWLRIKCL